MDKIMYATIKLVVTDTSTEEDLESNLSYKFNHKDIIYTDWVGLEEQK
tara:strand:+ start:1949 stop:2092 length:144 start_codon:yes stop_codon:yes gene_type:complete